MMSSKFKNHLRFNFFFLNIDNALQPFSMYQYAVSVVNSAGETTSQFTPIVTEEAPPDQVLPPVVKTDSSQLYVVDLSWDIPLKPNGNLLMENRYSELCILTSSYRFGRMIEDLVGISVP